LKGDGQDVSTISLLEECLRDIIRAVKQNDPF
jgi:hypothetical protein